MDGKKMRVRDLVLVPLRFGRDLFVTVVFIAVLLVMFRALGAGMARGDHGYWR